MYIPPAQVIHGISAACSKLRLPTNDEPSEARRRCLVRMTSGRDAVYIHTDFSRGWNVAWGTHTFSFLRYALPSDAALPRLM